CTFGVYFMHTETIRVVGVTLPLVRNICTACWTSALLSGSRGWRMLSAMARTLATVRLRGLDLGAAPTLPPGRSGVNDCPCRARGRQYKGVRTSLARVYCHAMRHARTDPRRQASSVPLSRGRHH